ncbi:mechanosensitive ion channel family protein [Clostridium sp. AM58-1XD]|uniref:mechanosensitive ion channel family protein n=1 Tax=Clostridium sp. AM58-1XD TaxID=2292307 RepID=UPI000E517313|nr:mechanosensitive ion channel family protein [Clostridium sp. AM58-1XD]RGY96292.1 mechanosensitive ion channel family protein [Clostridium sp. AM58-1XD]
MTEELTPNMLMDLLKSWQPGLIEFGVRLLIAVLIVIIGFRIVKIVRRMAARSFERIDMELSLRKFLLSLIQFLLYGIIVFMAAEKVGIKSSSIIAIFGSAGLALGLALQGSLSNFAGGVLILLMRPFKVGDYIVCDEGEGTVSMIGLVYTTLQTADNKRTVIPNGSLSNSPLTNVTSQEKRRVDIRVGIGYSSDLKKAKEIMGKIYRNHPLVRQDDPIDVFVDELADSAVMLGGRGWTDTENYWTVRWEITEALKLAFDEGGIEIPFQQMDVHMIEEKEK